MATPPETLKTTREAIRIRKVSVNNSKYKIPKSSSQPKISVPRHPKPSHDLASQQNFQVPGRLFQNLIEIESSPYQDEDSVLLTLNELLEPVNKRKISNRQSTEKNVMSHRILDTKAYLSQKSFRKHNHKTKEKPPNIP